MKKIISLLLAVIMVVSLLPVTVFATKPTYTITNGTPEIDSAKNHGYISINKETAAENEPVTVTVVPNKGYQLKSLTVTPVATFKAVYDTTDDANTLTFYYDTVDHKGDNSNITVYDNLPTAATSPFDWDYHSIRGSVKSVVIDSSVADYKGLTSTAYMFQNMTEATEISGAEYLDVSNVTDMSLMFQYFGGNPDSNPTTINVVPDVSNWNTGNVTNMNQMFLGYGYKSTALDTVPDVSNWNTGNVTSMKHMFNSYGYKSTELNTVPDVSNWNTGNVTNMYGMFNDYGNASTNISCVLDLSGWDLSKITETYGGDVFKFNPKTFNVTIPAKTGEKSNESGKWYYGDGTKSIVPPTGKTFTLEYVEIGGVKWATMNLGAEKETDYGDYFAWGATELAYSSFSSQTFTFVASRPASYGGSGWDQSKGFAYENTPYYNGSAYTKYTDSDSKTVLESGDDAATALLGSGWRMPTKEEFKALYDACGGTETPKTGGSTSTTEKGVYWCTNYDGVKGLLFCDGTNKLFFPAAGRGKDTSITEEGNGFYWSSSLNTSSSFGAYYLFFKSERVNPTSNFSRHGGCLVRPVKDAAPANKLLKSPAPKQLQSPAPAVPETITPAKQQDGTYQFTMPAYAVTVAATFEEEPEEPVRKNNNSTTITIGGNKAETKAEETVEENPDTGAPVMSFGAVAVVLGAAYVLSKKH